jgi:uncharacterized protein YndB with AHSA1/START domain
MTERSATHGTFSIERLYDATSARVFRAWADPDIKARWFAGSNDWKQLEREIDFRIGGRERLSGTWPNGRISTFEGHYHDIVPDERIVYSYAMRLNETRISVSLATVEFKSVASGTQLVFTEQAAFLDGYDDAGSRDRGTRLLLDRLEAELKRQAAGT